MAFLCVWQVVVFLKILCFVGLWGAKVVFVFRWSTSRVFFEGRAELCSVGKSHFICDRSYGKVGFLEQTFGDLHFFWYNGLMDGYTGALLESSVEIIRVISHCARYLRIAYFLIIVLLYINRDTLNKLGNPRRFCGWIFNHIAKQLFDYRRCGGIGMGGRKTKIR